MMRINRKVDNEFQLHKNNNISSEGANNIQESNIKTDEISSLCALKNTEYLQQKIENITQYLKPYISKMLNEV